MKKRYALITVLTVLMFTSCIKYGVSIDFSARGQSTIKYSFTFSRLFAALADSALFQNNLNRDSVDVIEDSLNITLVKTRKFKASQSSELGFEFARTGGGYTLRYSPIKGTGDDIISSPDTSGFIGMLYCDVALHVKDGVIVKHNGDSLVDGTVYKSIPMSGGAEESSLAVEVKTMNGLMIVTLAVIAGALIALFALYIFLRSRRNELE